MSNQPKVSIVVPFHWMTNWRFFLMRCLDSIESQSFKDYEIILMKIGSMPETSNRVIQKAGGEYIKVLYMDDTFNNTSALEKMVHIMDMSPDKEWLMTGATTNKKPHWTENIETGNNHLGSPSALMFRNHYENNLLFDETLSWLLDCDLYKRMNEKYGNPIISEEILIGIGEHAGQMTHILTNEQKLAEHEYMKKKYE